jgi:nicotinamidase-related amidase
MPLVSTMRDVAALRRKRVEPKFRRPGRNPARCRITLITLRVWSAVEQGSARHGACRQAACRRRAAPLSGSEVSRMRSDHAALIVIDAQRGFINDHSRHVLPMISQLADRWAAAGGAVAFSRYHNYPGSPFETFLGWTDVRTSPDTDIADELADRARRAQAVIDKTGYTVFNAVGLKVMAEFGWNDLVFCGLDTDTCVLKSAVDAFELGHTPWLVTDACASHSGADQHQLGLTMAGRFIGSGQLTTTCRLLADLDHPAA